MISYFPYVFFLFGQLLDVNGRLSLLDWEKHPDFILTNTKLDPLLFHNPKTGPSADDQANFCHKFFLHTPLFTHPIPLCLSDFNLDKEGDIAKKSNKVFHDLSEEVAKIITGFVADVEKSKVVGKIVDGNFYGSVWFEDPLQITTTTYGCISEQFDLSYENAESTLRKLLPESKVELSEFQYLKFLQRRIKMGKGQVGNLDHLKKQVNSIVTCEEIDSFPEENKNRVKRGWDDLTAKDSEANDQEVDRYHSDTKMKAKLERILSPNKSDEFYYVNVCYLVDLYDFTSTLSTKNFTSDKERKEWTIATVRGFVEISNWVLRSTDFNQDGVSDNIGLELLSVAFLNFSAFSPENKSEWIRNVDAKQFYFDQFTIPTPKYDFLSNSYDSTMKGTTDDRLDPKCSIITSVGKLNVGVYSWIDAGGCTACSDTQVQRVTSFTNLYMDTFGSERGGLQMLYHQIRILTTGLIHSSIDFDPTTNGESPKEIEENTNEIEPVFDLLNVDHWGDFLLEGQFNNLANLPLNHFHFSSDSLMRENTTCLKRLTVRDCFKMEKKPKDEGYCGNGIVEGNEECDCGSLPNCAELSCQCGPMNSPRPCRKLNEQDQQLCLELIQCRDVVFRLQFEAGYNSSTITDAIPGFFGKWIYPDDGGHPRKSQASSLLQYHQIFHSLFSYFIFSILTM